MNTSMKATSARTILSIVLTLAILGSAAGFYVGLKQVQESATEVNRASEDASAGNTKVVELKALQERLAKTQSLVAKADTMFAPVTEYRAKALNDLPAYASFAGITITNISFGDVPTGEAGQNGDTRPVTITLAQPVSYTGLIRFLELTEGSLPKMTVENITVRITENRLANQVNVDPITLRISVK